MPDFAVGDRVNWRPGSAHGWGWTGAPVAGIVEAIHARRSLTIRVARRVQGRWQIETKRVRAHNLTQRTRYCAELDLREETDHAD